MPDDAHRLAWLAESIDELPGSGIVYCLTVGQAEIAAACPSARNLRGATSFDEIVALARGATLAVGNDTGPMHLISAAGCPVVSLFSAESDPLKVAPIGPSVTVLRRDHLGDLPLDAVLEAFRQILAARVEAYRKGGLDALAPYERGDGEVSAPAVELAHALGEIHATKQLSPRVYDALAGRVPEVHSAGDCTGLGLIQKAVLEGAQAATRL